ncbi:MAG: hypothetical protein OEZ34_16300 [Spirochaetia bacterium]|nr:hypothetical protein [Spirochaetia bacterium]
MEIQKNITVWISLLSGIILILLSIAMFISSILSFLFPPDPAMGLPVSEYQILAGIILSILTAALSIPGILSRILKKENRKIQMMKISGYILLIFTAIFPFTIPISPVVTFFFLMMGASGLWILLWIQNNKNINL